MLFGGERPAEGTLGKLLTERARFGQAVLVGSGNVFGRLSRRRGDGAAVLEVRFALEKEDEEDDSSATAVAAKDDSVLDNIGGEDDVDSILADYEAAK